jgi:hypothetical protein
MPYDEKPRVSNGVLAAKVGSPTDTQLQELEINDGKLAIV